MRRTLPAAGATLAVLSAAPALAAPDACTAPGAARPAPPKAGPPLVPTAGQIPYPRVTDAAGVPAVERLLRGGSEVYDLGTDRGGVRLLYSQRPGDGQWAVFHVLPGGERVVMGGELLDLAAPPAEREVTRPRLRRIPGLTPAVDARGLRPAPADLSALEGAAYGVLGDPAAPRVWMVFDPLCPHSGPALDELRPAVEAGRMHVALVPVPLLDPDGAGPSTRAASALAAAPREGMAGAWAALVEGVRARRPLPEPPPSGAAAVARNKDAARAFGIAASPTFLWAGRDGRPAGLAGEGKAAAILAGAARP